MSLRITNYCFDWPYCVLPATFQQLVSVVDLKGTLQLVDVQDVANLFLVALVRSGFDRSSWPQRTYESHMEALKKIAICTTRSLVNALETEYGVKYSVLTDLPYFNPIRCTVIDPCTIYFWAQQKQ